ncbi:ROK family protein [Kribbella sp. VKM Ac-2566]|uniref:ROK family protein n=1 Tax=Kribbella sp. VKM Ac-2566 TaxID=2512218 RepID=UPI00192D900B|nr:ROK family protein [Kribbella sp. VKM Ac-2566]
MVDELIAGHLVEELPATRGTSGGRPSAQLVLARSGPCGLGLEVNVDYLAVCVVDLTGEVRYRDVVQQDLRGRTPRRVLKQLAQRARKGIDAVAEQGLAVAGGALAAPGLVETSTGLLRTAPNLGWRDVDMLALLATNLDTADLPMSVENVANFAALAELYAARGSEPPSFIHVSGEVGIGAGIVLNGTLYRGLHGWAGEIGHVVVDPTGPPCPCGSRGCLERYAGKEAVITRAGLATTATATLGGIATGDYIADLAEEGDREVLEALRETGRTLGITLAAAVNLLDIHHIVLGGIYRSLAPWLAVEVRREANERTLAAPWSELEVRPAAHGEDAAVVGAAQSVVAKLLNNPAVWQRGTALRSIRVS